MNIQKLSNYKENRCRAWESTNVYAHTYGGVNVCRSSHTHATGGACLYFCTRLGCVGVLLHTTNRLAQSNDCLSDSHSPIQALNHSITHSRTHSHSLANTHIHAQTHTLTTCTHMCTHTCTSCRTLSEGVNICIARIHRPISSLEVRSYTTCCN